MNFIEFKKNFSNIDKAVFLFEGEDAYFREKGIEHILNAYVPGGDIDFSSIEGESLGGDPNRILGDLLSPPFICPKRVVLVREFYPKQEVLKGEFLSYLNAPNDYSILVISNSKKSDQLIKLPNVCVVDCDKANSEVLVKWVVAEMKRNNVFISYGDAEKVVEYSLMDMTKIAGETDKLIDFGKIKGEITAEDVNALVIKENDYKIYELTEYIASKNFTKALFVLDDMLAQNNPPQYIMGGIYNYFRRLLHISLSDKNDEELSKILGIKEYAVKKSRMQASKFKKKALKKAVDNLSLSDYNSKSGQSDFDTSLMLNIFKIMTEN